jgi:hypothetical protein
MKIILVSIFILEKDVAKSDKNKSLGLKKLFRDISNIMHVHCQHFLSESLGATTPQDI